MKVKINTLDVRRSETTTIRVDVPAWEVPLMLAMHGDVTHVGQKLVEADVPDVEEEYNRLTGRYGRERLDDGGLGKPYCEAVYGQYQPGIDALGRAIEAAKVA